MNATSIFSHGRTVIPAVLRQQIGIREGDQLIWEIRDDELVVTTRIAQLRRAQALIHRYVAESVSLTDELTAERRVEQTREDAR